MKGGIYPCGAPRSSRTLRSRRQRTPRRRSRDEAADRARQQLPPHGDAHHLRPRRVARDLRPGDRPAALGYEDVRALDRVPVAPRAAVPAPAGGGAARDRPSVLDRGPRLRPRLPPPPHRGATARGPVPARRARGADLGAPPRPHPTAVGDVRHRRARGRLRRGADQDPPLVHRRRRGRGDPGRAPRRRTGTGTDAAADEPWQWEREPSQGEMLARRCDRRHDASAWSGCASPGTRFRPSAP